MKNKKLGLILFICLTVIGIGGCGCERNIPVADTSAFETTKEENVTEEKVETESEEESETVGESELVEDTVQEVINNPWEIELEDAALENIRENESEKMNAALDLYLDITQRTTSQGRILTQEEIDTLKGNPPEGMAGAIEMYETAMSEGSVDDGMLEAVVTGSPYDTSWRRMTDEEIDMLLEDAASGYDPYNPFDPFTLFLWEAAEAEAMARDGEKIWVSSAFCTNTERLIYYDFYQYYAENHMEPGREYCFGRDFD